MSAVDAQLARVLVETGELELALAWAEGETRALYAMALVTLTNPELATNEEYAEACVLRDHFHAMFAGYCVIAAADDEEAPGT